MWRNKWIKIFYYFFLSCYMFMYLLWPGFSVGLFIDIKFDSWSFYLWGFETFFCNVFVFFCCPLLMSTLKHDNPSIISNRLTVGWIEDVQKISYFYFLHSLVFKDSFRRLNFIHEIFYGFSKGALPIPTNYVSVSTFRGCIGYKWLEYYFWGG